MRQTITLIAFFLVFAASSCNAFENQELKPCFERYDHQKLIDSEPFHSEWRMKSEEDCLPFCALSSSRCRTIVYDVLSHICHYFSEEGLENAVIARRMTLFRVANRQCLLDVTKSDEVQEGEEYDDEHSPASMSIQKPPIAEPTKEPEYKQPESVEQSEPAEVPSASSTYTESPVTTALPTEAPLEEAYDLIDAVKTEDDAKASFVHEVPTDDSDLIPQSEEIKSEVELPTATLTATTKKQSKLVAILTPKESNEQQKEGDIYIPYPEDKFKPKLIPLLASKMAQRPRNLKLVALGGSSTGASTEENAPAFLPPMKVFKADRINKEEKEQPEIRRNPTSFSKAIVLKKSESTENGAEDEYQKVLAPATVPVAKSYSLESIEETPLKSVETRVPIAKPYSSESVPAYIPKARGFLKSINGNKNPDVINLEAKAEETAAPSAAAAAGNNMFAIKIASHVDQKPVDPTPQSGESLYDDCGSSDSHIWIGVENSEISTTVGKNAVSANDVESCKKFCIAANKQKAMCSSFTFYEIEKLCVMHSAGEGFHLKKAVSDKFTTRSYKKFCYPEKLSAFNGCSDFIAFRDYTLEVEAKEQFDGMPKGVEGLQACVELCVHSPDFRCKSAAFDMESGQCFVYDENSFTKPNAWREHLQNDLIYFENGCDMWFTEKVPAEASIKRVVTTAKPVTKELSPLGQKKPSYMLFGSGQTKHLQFNPLRRPVA